MTTGGDSFAIQSIPHEQGYVVVRCQIGPLYDFDMALHTTRPLSYLSVDAAEAVSLFGDIMWIGGAIHRVRNLTIGGRTFPELFVRISSGPSLLDFDGFLGLHFLKQFREICFDQTTGVLTVSE